jgi:hypothetical protein
LTCSDCKWFHPQPHTVGDRPCDGWCRRHPQWIHKNKATPACGDSKPNIKKKVKKMDVSAELLVFDEARKLYPGDKVGNETEFLNFQAKNKSDWKEKLPLLKPAIERQIQWREDKKEDFYPRWKGFSVWINASYWEFSPVTGQKTLKKCHVCKQVRETKLKILKGSMKTSKSPVCKDCWNK